MRVEVPVEGVGLTDAVLGRGWCLPGHLRPEAAQTLLGTDGGRWALSSSAVWASVGLVSLQDRNHSPGSWSWCLPGRLLCPQAHHWLTGVLSESDLWGLLQLLFPDSLVFQ